MFLGTASVPSPYSPILLFGGFFNAYMASFNLVPFGMLDGLKIFNWNKIIWGLVFATSAALTVIGYMMYSPYLK